MAGLPLREISTADIEPLLNVLSYVDKRKGAALKSTPKGSLVSPGGITLDVRDPRRPAPKNQAIGSPYQLASR